MAHSPSARRVRIDAGQTAGQAGNEDTRVQRPAMIRKSAARLGMLDQTVDYLASKPA
jgi:hypothetical protein